MINMVVHGAVNTVYKQKSENSIGGIQANVAPEFNAGLGVGASEVKETLVIRIQWIDRFKKSSLAPNIAQLNTCKIQREEQRKTLHKPIENAAAYLFKNFQVSNMSFFCVYQFCYEKISNVYDTGKKLGTKQAIRRVLKQLMKQ